MSMLEDMAMEEIKEGSDSNLESNMVEASRGKGKKMDGK